MPVTHPQQVSCCWSGWRAFPPLSFTYWLFIMKNKTTQVPIKGWGCSHTTGASAVQKASLFPTWWWTKPPGFLKISEAVTWTTWHPLSWASQVAVFQWMKVALSSRQCKGTPLCSRSALPTSKSGSVLCWKAGWSLCLPCWIQVRHLHNMVSSSSPHFSHFQPKAILFQFNFFMQQCYEHFISLA